MSAFCADRFPKGILSTRGKYWETPGVWLHIKTDDGQVHNLKFNMRISLVKGGFFDWDDPKNRYPNGNPLLLWMIAQDVVLDEEWKCRSKADLVRSVRELNEWCDRMDALNEEERTVETELDPEVKQSLPDEDQFDHTRGFFVFAVIHIFQEGRFGRDRTVGILLGSNVRCSLVRIGRANNCGLSRVRIMHCPLIEPQDSARPAPEENHG